MQELPPQQFDDVNSIEHAEQVLRDIWVDKRRLEEVERQGQEEVRRALVSWATQRARVNEEIARKQESSRFASRSQQLYSRPNSRPTTAKSRGSGSSPTNVKVHMDFGIDEDSDHRCQSLSPASRCCSALCSSFHQTCFARTCFVVVACFNFLHHSRLNLQRY